jgi:hypothetical protein
MYEMNHASSMSFDLSEVNTEDDFVGDEFSSSTSDEDCGVEYRRDEVVEVRKMSSKDSSRLRNWRLVVGGVLLLTAFTVTYTTFLLLRQQEENNFTTAVRSLLLCRF